MLGSEVYQVLQTKSIDQLHHANSVTTSCTFLRLGGLASRGHVADRGLPQTPQYTDDIDRKYGIWYDVFVDTVDIHDRASKRNEYGPVLFVLGTTVLNNLPPESEVLVTKKNPTKWVDSETDAERFFMTPDELEMSLVKGTFDQMIVIRTANGILPFPEGSVRMILDDPQRTLAQRDDAFSQAKTRLLDEHLPKRFPISKRVCRDSCKCVKQYATLRAFNEIFQ